MPALAARLVSHADSTQPIVHVLLMLSITFASISVLSTLAALYWFVKMRRSFRHEYVTT
jgi:G protein-coupled receptor GPR1